PAGEETLHVGEALYEIVVHALQTKLIRKTVRTAADVVSCFATMDVFRRELLDPTRRFVVFAVVHCLWTPFRMEYIVRRFDPKSSDLKAALLSAVEGVDDDLREADYELADDSLRTHRIKGQTNERSVGVLIKQIELLEEIARIVGDVTVLFETRAAQLRRLVGFRDYHPMHFLRTYDAVMYGLDAFVGVETWVEAGKMSKCIAGAISLLGFSETSPNAETPKIFAARLARDSGVTLGVGDALLVLCEAVQAVLHTRTSIKDLPRLTAEFVVALRKHMTKNLETESFVVLPACLVLKELERIA
ncbi:MAG: hypothetical protein AAFR01_09395, partial [Pseudomonadota bacterium]